MLDVYDGSGYAFRTERSIVIAQCSDLPSSPPQEA